MIPAIIALALLTLAEAESETQPEPEYALLTTPSTFRPLDLRLAMNADPWNPEAMRVPNLQIADTPFVFLEAERTFRNQGAEAVALDAASGGEALRGLANEDDWAEWAFDLPFDTDEAILYIRYTRPLGAHEDTTGGFHPFTLLSTAINHRPGAVLYAHATTSPSDFDGPIAQANIGIVRMGRQLLRLAVRIPGEPVTIDCLWLGARQLDIPNELDGNGRVRRPFSIATLAYQPGRLVAGNIPFDLLDPRANDGRAVILATHEPATIPLRGEAGDALLLLGAGGQTPAQGLVTVVYADGEETTVSVTWPALYARSADTREEIAVPLGLFRHAWVRRLPIDPKPLAALSIQRENNARLVLLAATLQRAATDATPSTP